MLDFYSFANLDGWPDDIPATAGYLGSLDIEDFHSCLPALLECVGDISFPSFFDDWTISATFLVGVTECFERQCHQKGGDSRAMLHLLSILKSSLDSGLLAVCD